MAKEFKNKLSAMDCMAFLGVRASTKPKDVSEEVAGMLGAVSSPEQLQFFLMEFDVDHCTLPEKPKRSQEYMKTFAKALEHIRVYRTIRKLSPEQLEVLDMLVEN